MSDNCICNSSNRINNAGSSGTYDANSETFKMFTTLLWWIIFSAQSNVEHEIGNYEKYISVTNCHLFPPLLLYNVCFFDLYSSRIALKLKVKNPSASHLAGTGNKPVPGETQQSGHYHLAFVCSTTFNYFNTGVAVGGWGNPIGVVVSSLLTYSDRPR